MLTIGLDCGTQSTKCLVYDVDTRQIVGRGAVSYGLDSARQGQAEQDPAVWLDACKGAISQALATCDASQVRGIAVSGQQHGLVVLDAAGAVIRPAKLWCDMESHREAAELSQLWGATVVPSITATKLLWLKRNEPEAYARVARVCLPHDYVNLWLTGAFTMEASDASGMGIFDPVRRRWDAQRIADVDPALAGWLPRAVLAPTEPAGALRPELARELGLPESGVVVGPGGGDNAMSTLGAGAVAPGVWVLSLGTSGTLFGPSVTPILDPTGTICPFCDADGKGLPLLCTVNCTEVPGEVGALAGRDHAQLTAAAQGEAPGCGGVTFLPYMRGERTPNWPHATGTLLGLQPGAMRAGLLYRAAMEGATFSLLQGLRKMRETEGVEATELRAVGGGSKNPLWRRIIADAFQLPLRFPVEAETAALGAALQAAAVASGAASVSDFVGANQPQLEEETLQPDAAAAAAYAQAFDRFVRLGEALFGGPDGGAVGHFSAAN